MRHRKAHRKLGHDSEHRKALLRNLATSLIKHERIRTTDAKAKELRRYVERLVTLAKRGDLHARRQATRKLFGKETVQKLFDTYAKRFESRPGGYTRIIKDYSRPGDNSPISIIEFLPDVAVITSTDEVVEESIEEFGE